MLEQPIPWNKGLGASGIQCKRILDKALNNDIKTALLPLCYYAEEELPEIGNELIILQTPYRGIPFCITSVEMMKLNDLNEEHFVQMDISKEDYLAKWDEINIYKAKSNPTIILLTLVPLL